MVRDPFDARDDPELVPILEALEDEDCRAIVQALDAPLSASDLSEACDIPMSTIYRKLDLLSESSLLTELTEIRSDGHHTTRYEVAFEEIRIYMNEEQTLDIEIERPPRTADERLAEMWSEVQKEV